MRKARPEAFLLDLDGTLIKSKEAVERTLNETLMELGYEPFTEKEILDHLGTPLDDLLLMKVRKEDVKKVKEKYMEKFFNQSIGEVEVYEGIPELLQELKEEGFKVAIVTTKGEEEALKVIEHLGLSKYIDAVVAHNDETLPKPNADPILKACSLLKVKPERAVMVGDTHLDIVAGLSAGTYANIAVLWGIGKKEELEHADHLVSTVEELREKIRKLR